MNPHSSYLKANNCREFLVEEFEERKKRRPAYSIRAFARDINFDASRLTSVLNGKYGISKAAAMAIGEKLNFEDAKLRFFSDLAESQFARSKVSRDRALERIEKARFNFDTKKLNSESPDILKHWYYAGVHQLVGIEGSALDTERIANKLNISIAEAKDALEFLIKHSFIKVANGYEVTDRHLQCDSPTPSQTIRNYHHELLNKTSQAIEAVEVAQRKNLSSVFSIEDSQLNEARDFMTKMHKEFIERFGTSPKANRVYALGFHMVPVDGGRSEN